MYYTMQRYKMSGDRLTLISTAETKNMEGVLENPTARLVNRIKEAFIRRTPVTFTMGEDNEAAAIIEISINYLPVYPN